MKDSWTIGVTFTCIGLILLLFVFYLGYREFTKYSVTTIVSIQFTEILSTLFYVSIEVMLLAVMCWVASIILSKGVEFIKISRTMRGEMHRDESD